MKDQTLSDKYAARNTEDNSPLPPVKDRPYYEEKMKKCMFYWSYLEVICELNLEILEELREIRKHITKNGEHK